MFLAMCPGTENPHISHFNMDISLNNTYLLEGNMSPNIDIGVSFCCMVCRKREFEKKSQRFTVTFFSHKI